jgi:hypothetical protein
MIHRARLEQVRLALELIRVPGRIRVASAPSSGAMPVRRVAVGVEKSLGQLFVPASSAAASSARSLLP